MKLAIKYAAITMGIILSIGIGYEFGVMQTAKSCSVATGVLASKFLASESEYLEILHKEPDNNIKIRSLEHFVNILNLMPVELDSLIGDKAKLIDLALSYARLSLLYRGIDENKSHLYLEKAIRTYPAKNGETIAAEKLIDLVKKLDESS